MVVLLSPSLASWAKPGSSFMKNLIQWWSSAGSCSSIRQGRHKYCVAAVVDKISGPPNITGPHDSAGETPQDLGHEGIALLFLNQSDVHTRSGNAHSDNGDWFDNENDAKPALIFSPSSKSPSKRIGVGLQIANTVFQNGRERTLIASHWESHPSESKHEFPPLPTLLCQKEVLKCSVDTSMQGAYRHPQNSCRGLLTIPLTPITQPRRISACMGNILSKLEGQQELTQGRKTPEGHRDSLKSQLPASRELEREIPRFIAENNLENKPIAVWALVGNSFEDIDDGNATRDAANLLERNKVRMYRVMSGGGGWGPKTGLLSLDEDCPTKLRDQDEYSIKELFHHDHDNLNIPSNAEAEESTSDNSMLQLFQMMNPSGGNNSIATIRPGRYVQFFVASLDSSTNVAGHSDTTTSSGAPSVAFDLEFGVIPQFEDFSFSFPSGSADVGETVKMDRSMDTVIPVPGFFGALSAKNIIYSSLTLLCSKIDVPGSRLSLPCMK